MNKFIVLILLVVCMLSSFGFSYEGISGYEGKTDVLNNLNSNPADFEYWTCDLVQAPSMIEFGSCYCMDVFPGIGKVSIGVGNLASCLVESTEGVVSTLSGPTRGINYVINISSSSIDYNLDSSVVTINSFGTDFVGAGSNVECSDTYSGSLDQKYILYREAPFQVLDSSFNSILTVPFDVLHSSNNLKCRVIYYDDSSWRGSRDSSNFLTYAVEEIAISDVYLAPAHPTVNDTLYCYGIPYWDIAEGHIDLNISIKNNDGDIVANNFTDGASDNARLSVGYDLSSESKGKNFTCEFNVSYYNDENTLIETVTQVSDSLIINNFRPIAGIKTMVRSFEEGQAAFNVYSPDALKVAEFKNGGIIYLRGTIKPLISCIESDLLFKVNDALGNLVSGIDKSGNLCGTNFYDANCLDGYLNIKNKLNDVKISFGSYGICYEGYVFEGETWS